MQWTDKQLALKVVNYCLIYSSSATTEYSTQARLTCASAATRAYVSIYAMCSSTLPNQLV